MAQVYLNGEFLPLAEARVPVMDRGFLFGDGVYEVIPAYGGKLFRLPHHLYRLNNSLTAIRIPDPLSNAEWRDILEKLVQWNEGDDQSVYLQVTRGVQDKRDHAFAGLNLKPTVFAMSSPLQSPSSVPATTGIKTVTLDDVRWQHCNIKAITLLPNALLRQQAVDQGATEAVLIRNGHAIEGAASNLFIVKDGLMITPPNSHLLLPGITRDLLVELAAEHARPFREADITLEELQTADEIWLTSSTKELLPVVELDGTPVGNGQPGPIYRDMHCLYRDYKDRVRAGEAD